MKRAIGTVTLLKKPKGFYIKLFFASSLNTAHLHKAVCADLAPSETNIVERHNCQFVS